MKTPSKAQVFELVQNKNVFDTKHWHYFLRRLPRTGYSPVNWWQWLRNGHNHIIVKAGNSQIKPAVETEIESGLCHFCRVFQVFQQLPSGIKNINDDYEIRRIKIYSSSCRYSSKAPSVDPREQYCTTCKIFSEVSCLF